MFGTVGKVALVTGALGGLGRACVKSLLRNEVKGVLMIGRTDDKAESFVKELEVEFGDGKVAFAKANLANKVELRGIYEKAISEFGQLDIVINNAGVGEDKKEVIVDVNLGSVVDSTYMAMEEYLPKYKNDNEAVILNFSSLGGLLPLELAPMYSATKAGLVTFGRCIKSKNNGVKVVTLCPGYSRMVDFLRKWSQEQIKIMSDGLDCTIQSAEFVADTMVEVIKVGSNGSVWVVNNGRPAFEVDFEDSQNCMLKQVLSKW